MTGKQRGRLLQCHALPVTAAVSLQATWIGYPNSTGLRSVDFRITDAEADPVDTQQTFTEQLLRMPGCFLCYTPAQGANHEP